MWNMWLRSLAHGGSRSGPPCRASCSQRGRLPQPDHVSSGFTALRNFDGRRIVLPALAGVGAMKDFSRRTADAGGKALDFGAHVVDGLGFGGLGGFGDDVARGVQIGEAGAGDDFAKASMNDDVG